MHPVAKKCLIAGIVTLVVASGVLAFGAELMFGLLAPGPDGSMDVGIRIVQLVIGLAQGGLAPLGAVLVGAAIVVQTLAPRPEPRGDVEDLGTFDLRRPGDEAPGA